MNSKKELITKAIFDNLPYDSVYTALPLSKLESIWWATRRSTNCLRLSEDGEKAFTEAEIEFYEFPLTKLEKQSYTRFVRKVSRLLNCPYYIGFKNKMFKSAYIKVYDSKVAMLITLYGSFSEYLECNNHA